MLQNEMKKLIRNGATRAFLAAQGNWTPDQRLAAVFPNASAALIASIKHCMTDMELF
jgi:hypothetical protein